MADVLRMRYPAKLPCRARRLLTSGAPSPLRAVISLSTCLWCLARYAGGPAAYTASTSIPRDTIGAWSGSRKTRRSFSTS